MHVNWLSPTKVRTTIIGGSTQHVVWDDLNPSQRLSVYDRGVDLEQHGRRRGAVSEPQVAYRVGRHGRAGAPRARGAAGVVDELVPSDPRATGSR